MALGAMLGVVEGFGEIGLASATTGYVAIYFINCYTGGGFFFTIVNPSCWTVAIGVD